MIDPQGDLRAAYVPINYFDLRHKCRIRPAHLQLQLCVSSFSSSSFQASLSMSKIIRRCLSLRFHHHQFAFHHSNSMSTMPLIRYSDY